MAEAAANATHPREETDRECGCRGGPSGRTILDRRYARGEITRGQYEQMKQDLGGDTKSEKSKKGCC
jgi:uncharacterized membrane protein